MAKSALLFDESEDRGGRRRVVEWIKFVGMESAMAVLMALKMAS